eukprot:2972521-Rhodomonas_salina.1
MSELSVGCDLRRIHPAIIYKKPHSWYKLYGDCRCIAYPIARGTRGRGRGRKVYEEGEGEE